MQVTLRYPGGISYGATECTWDQVVAQFKACAAQVVNTRTPGPDSQVLGILFAGLPPGQGEGGPFSLATVEASPGLWAMAWDFDDVTQVGFEAALETIKTCGFERGLAHTTWSFGVAGVWTPERPIRARVICPFDEPVPPTMWREIWERCASIAAACGASPDGQCKNVNRWYYLPATNAAAPEWAKPCWIEEW